MARQQSNMAERRAPQRHRDRNLLIEDLVILELKSVDSLQPIHEAQLLTYLKLTGFKVGLLINFNVPVLTDGIRRLIV